MRHPRRQPFLITSQRRFDRGLVHFLRDLIQSCRLKFDHAHRLSTKIPRRRGAKILSHLGDTSVGLAIIDSA